MHRIVSCLMLGALAVLANTGSAAEVLDLGAALARARESNPDLRQAAAVAAMAQASASEASSAYMPRVDVGVGYQVTNEPGTAFGYILNQGAFGPGIDFNDPGTTDDLRLSARIGWRAFDGSRGAQVDAAQSGAAAALVHHQAAGRDLDLAVAEAWLATLARREAVSAAEISVEAVAAHHARLTAGGDEGAELKIDVLEAAVQLEQARTALIIARGSERRARVGLARLLLLDPADLVLPDAVPELAMVEQGLSQSELDRIRAVRLRMDSANAAMRAARGEYLPSLDLVAGGAYDYGFETDSDGTSYAVGLSLSWSAWDGGGRSARYERASADLTRARAQLTATQAQVDEQYRLAQIQLTEAVERLATAKRGLELALSSVEVATESYQAGAAVLARVLDAEAAAAEARQQVVAARVGRQVAVARLRHALGLDIVAPQ
ncbi:MAG: TolC family protein [Planctomycetota bacterium]|jgi:outer membrane protein|nr:TolC family protein [Planctomycetota bacterium]